MDREYKRRLFSKTFLQVILHYIRCGLKKSMHSSIKFTAIICLVISFIFFNNRVVRFEADALIHKPHPSLLLSFFIVLGFTLCFCLLMILFGIPKYAKRFHDNFQRAGIINSAMEAPALLERTYDENNPKIQRLVFFSKGIPLSSWKDNKEKIESALNISIDRIELGENNQLIVVYAVDGCYQLPDIIEWSDSYLSSKDFTLILGESLTSRVEVDLSITPHILLGGSTGSGKTLLLKLLLKQCVTKHAKVFLADFKGGVDFNKSWKNHIKIITEPEELGACLNTLVDELHRRKRLFAEMDCANINEYNRMCHANLPRMVFACDEVAQILDKTGQDKKTKEQIQQYEASLATLVRLGRAFGIHTMLATQRPEASVISGQLKSNIDARICGRADDVLSMIVLDKTDANDLISKTAQGRFLTNDDVLFQAFYFNDKKAW